MAESKPYIIVLGNEKGGTGKSTAAMHIVVSLLKLNFKVGSIDIDARQGTFTRYQENRQAYINATNNTLPLSAHHAIHRSTLDTVKDAEAQDKTNFENALTALATCDFIVIDTPGSDNYLSRLAHSYADTLITPLNDSLIDLDMLVRLDPESLKIVRPSTYAEMVWEQRKHRAVRGQAPTDWIVMRNRLSSIYNRNKEEMQRVLEVLSQRIGFRVGNGFGERVIFRELFLKGLTLHDMEAIGTNLTLSHIAARQELRELIQMIRLPQINEKLEVA